MSHASGRPPDRGKERFWRRMLRQWRRSGLSVRTFCRLHRLSEASWYAWRRTLAQRDAQAVAFVPVQVVPETPPATADDAPRRLELVLRDGRLLRIAPGFDAATLRHLLAVLEEDRPC